MTTPRLDRFERDGLVFPVVDSGPAAGVPVVLLHGWPQDARTWERLAPLLHAEGFRTYAPAMRGGAAEVSPRSRWAYRKTVLADDVVALVEQVGAPVHLVGHDWGAAVAWLVATRSPSSLRTLAAVSVPHMGAFVRALGSPSQLLSSWYIGANQLPWVPELVLGDPARTARLLVRAGQEPGLARRDAALLADPVVRRGGLNLYRALVADAPSLRGTTTVPALQVWGEDDVAVTGQAFRAAPAHARGPYAFAALPGVGHWLPEQAPAQLAALLLAHWAEHR